jgi:hypothetical protein
VSIASLSGLYIPCHNAGMTTRCVRCGSSFDCDPAGDCWCKTPPYLPMPVADETCLCPDCLARAREAAARPKSDTPSAS